MPYLNGIETTKDILKIRKKDNLKIIGCTGNSEESFIEKFKEAGVETVLVKPIKKKTIEKLLEQYKNLLN